MYIMILLMYAYIYYEYIMHSSNNLQQPFS